MNKEKSCFCLRACGQRKCCLLMFVLDLEETEVSCCKVLKPKTGTGLGRGGGAVFLHLPAPVPAPGSRGQVSSGQRGTPPPSARCSPAPPGVSPASGLLTTVRLETGLVLRPRRSWERATPCQKPAVQNVPRAWPLVLGRELSFNED